ncbi:MAG: Uma2 family endonuclease [Hyphomicrobiaceae bacterium]
MKTNPSFEFERMSLDDFEELLLEKPENEKWELIDGRVYRGMVGARWEHHVIVDNIGLAIGQHLRQTKRPCRVFRETFYLKKQSDDLAALPDIMIRCGARLPGVTSIDDPVILFEVVSPGSEAKDRMTKRLAYQKLPSLTQYVLVARDSLFVDVYRRTREGWRGDVPLERLDDVLTLPAIEFELTLAEIYRDVIVAPV